MIIETRRDVITLRGSLTDNQWPAIQAAAKIMLEEYPRGIIIDCSHLTEITEAGARTFLEAMRWIQKCDAKIIVAGLPESAFQVIRQVRAVASQLPTAPTVEDARLSLGLEELTARTSGRGLNVIAVLLIGDWQEAIDVACKIADRRRDEIHFFDLIKVPRNLPLATPLPEAEAVARRKLEEGEREARRYRLSVVKRVERVRSTAEGIPKVIRDVKPAAAVICVSRVDEEGYEIVQTMPTLLSDPPCTVIYVRKPEAQD